MRLSSEAILCWFSLSDFFLQLQLFNRWHSWSWSLMTWSFLWQSFTWASWPEGLPCPCPLSSGCSGSLSELCWQEASGSCPDLPWKLWGSGCPRMWPGETGGRPGFFWWLLGQSFWTGARRGGGRSRAEGAGGAAGRGGGGRRWSTALCWW